MLVLLTNDDGIGARGLHELRRALGELDGVEVRVIAPDSNRSASARSITTRSPIWVEEVEFDDGTIGFATEGTPVDCVRFAELGLLGERPDLIVSGINHGSNLGDDVTYSGTVAAAFEGIVLGLPGDRRLPAGRSRRHGLRGPRVRLHLLGRRRPRGRAQADRRAAVAVDPDQHQLPGRRAERDRDHAPRQAPLRRRAEAGRGGRRRAQALQDLRLRALVRGRAGHRPRRRRPRPGGDHPDPLRPHRPRRDRAPRRLGPRTRWGPSWGWPQRRE